MLPLTDIGGGFQLQTVERHALDAEGRPGLATGRFEVLAQAADQFPPGADGMAPECLQFGLVGHALFAFAFSAQPQAVDVAADPGIGVPVQGTAAVKVLVFQLLDDHCPVALPVVDLMAGQGREGGLAVGVGNRP
ncbi:hypothetical protein D3C79_882050 [compost metagenome]